MSEVLKDKQYIQSDHISRYATFPIYYNTRDNKYVNGITSQLREDTPYVEVKIEPGDNLDNLSEHYYGRPDYYWIIADFNRITDSFTELYGKYKTLRVPVLSNIAFKN